MLQFQEEHACFLHFLFEVSPGLRQQTDGLRAITPPPLLTCCYLLIGLFSLQYQPLRNELVLPPSSSVTFCRTPFGSRPPRDDPSSRAQTPAGVLGALLLDPEGGVFPHTLLITSRLLEEPGRHNSPHAVNYSLANCGISAGSGSVQLNPDPDII